jgi:hypothetical protein
MKEKSALMLRSVRDVVTQRRGKVSGYQNNVYRVEFPNGESALRHRNQITEVDYNALDDFISAPDPAGDLFQQKLAPGCYRRLPAPNAE